MSFLSNIFGPAIGETVKGIGEGVGTLAKDLRTAITGEISPDKRAELEELAARAESMAMQGQTAINKIEAGHKSIFVAGWRPFIGWVCGVARLGIMWCILCFYGFLLLLKSKPNLRNSL